LSAHSLSVRLGVRYALGTKAFIEGIDIDLADFGLCSTARKFTASRSEEGGVRVYPAKLGKKKLNLGFETSRVRLFDRERSPVFSDDSVLVSNGLSAFGDRLRDRVTSADDSPHLRKINHEQTSRTNQPDAVFYDRSSRVSSKE